MPRYFFRLHDEAQAVADDSTDLPDAVAARTRAIKLASDYIGNPRMLGKDGGAIVINVRGVEMEDVFTVRLAFTVTAE